MAEEETGAGSGKSPGSSGGVRFGFTDHLEGAVLLVMAGVLLWRWLG